MIEQKKIKSVLADLTTNQKRVIAGITLLIVVALAIGWTNAFFAWNDIRVEKSKRVKAEKDADKALKSAAKIATELKKEKAELKVLEVKKTEKKNEVKQSKTETQKGRDDYDRAVREQRADDVSPDELCTELAELGYPCK